MVDQIKELHEKLEKMESEHSPAIATPMVTPVSNPIPTPRTSVSWGDTYDPLSSNTLNPHVLGAATTYPVVSTTEATPNILYASWRSFGRGNLDQPATQASRSGMQQFVHNNTFF